MRLTRLLEPLGLTEGFTDVEISDLVYDSRKAKPGCAFICMRGSASDEDISMPKMRPRQGPLWWWQRNRWRFPEPR